MTETSESHQDLRGKTCLRWAADEVSLESLPEIERENILAGRLEEMQKFKDSQALDAMYKMAGMADDEEEDEPKKRRRSCPPATATATRQY